jgi:hypothetical protein
MIKIQQEMGPDFKQPWSVIIGEGGEVIYGRPDATHLIGFGQKGSYEIPLTAALALAQPELAVGKVPTFLGHDGVFFTVDLKVRSAEVWTSSEDNVEALRAREQEYRGIIIHNDSEEG